MGPGKHENVGESQSVLIMINRMISSRTRTALRWEALHAWAPASSLSRPFPHRTASDQDKAITHSISLALNARLSSFRTASKPFSRPPEQPSQR
jgi:hypothetical protein